MPWNSDTGTYWTDAVPRSADVFACDQSRLALMATQTGSRWWHGHGQGITQRHCRQRDLKARLPFLGCVVERKYGQVP